MPAHGFVRRALILTMLAAMMHHGSAQAAPWKQFTLTDGREVSGEVIDEGGSA